jgi:hypothetical protein
MALFQDLIDKVKGKKKVEVKEYLRKTPHGGVSRVEHYEHCAATDDGSLEQK